MGALGVGYIPDQPELVVGEDYSYNWPGYLYGIGYIPSVVMVGGVEGWYADIGTAVPATTAQVWDGAAWVPVGEAWNGSAWVSLAGAQAFDGGRWWPV